MTDPGSLAVFGCGYSASRYLARFSGAGEPMPVSVPVSVLATTRTADRFAAIARLGARPLLYSGAADVADVAAALLPGSDVLISIAPDAAGDPVLRHFSATLAQIRPRWIGYLSTVGVYGDHGGGRVDEATAPRPSSARSRSRLAAENGWRDFAARTATPLAVLRLAGIYGPGRNAFVNLERGTARRLVKPEQVFNRIHVEDIAAAIAACRAAAFEGIVNVADDEPAPPQDVVAFAAALAGVAPPQEEAFATARLTAMQRSFYGENKRVANRRLKEELGVRLMFPTYREALAAMWPDDWR